MGYTVPYQAKQVTYRRTGEGQLFQDPNVDRAREHFRAKSRALVSKVMTVADAVRDLIADGDYLSIGGFGGTRIPTAVLHEVVRQGRKGLGLSGHTATHDCQILAASSSFDRCDVAYVIGLEARGLSPAARRHFERGGVRVTEWSNAALAWRYKAAAMGVPFVPARSMLGTDTERASAAVRIECPFTGQTLLALPALYPDVAIIHAHRADVYGNAQIDGIMVADWDLARAAKRLIVTTERLIPNAEIRNRPDRTAIPYFLVDAVCEVPYGSYPGCMPYEYYSDERHLREWLEAEGDDARYKVFLDRYIYGVGDFAGYLERCGGIERLRQLRAEELCVDREGREGR